MLIAVNTSGFLSDFVSVMLSQQNEFDVPHDGLKENVRVPITITKDLADIIRDDANGGHGIQEREVERVEHLGPDRIVLRSLSWQDEAGDEQPLFCHWEGQL